MEDGDTTPRSEFSRWTCTAHSLEYDVTTNTIRPLFIQTDIWCSSSTVMPNGQFVQTGGFNNGEMSVRVFKPCPTCNWEEIENRLATQRWYATNHILLDGRAQIIIGGRQQFNYKVYPHLSAGVSPIPKTNIYLFPFPAETINPDQKQENNLYPFVFLNLDGHFLVFVNNRAVLFDYKNNKFMKRFLEIPGGNPKSYKYWLGSAIALKD